VRAACIALLVATVASGCLAGVQASVGPQFPTNEGSDRYGAELAVRGGLAYFGAIGATVSLRGKAGVDYGAFPIVAPGLILALPMPEVAPYVVFELGLLQFEHLPGSDATFGVGPRVEIGAFVPVGDVSADGFLALTAAIAFEWMERLAPAQQGDGFVTLNLGVAWLDPEFWLP
jgi:hypothetical protein